MSKRDDLPPEAAGPSAAAPSVRLVRFAARWAPPDLAERLEEEWTAHLAEEHGAIGRTRFALGCCWATAVIGHAPHLYGARLSAAGHGNVDAINTLHPSLLPARAVVLLLITLLHVAVALALIYAFRVHELAIPPQAMTGGVLIDKNQAPPPPPALRPRLPQDTFSIPVIPSPGPLQLNSADAIQSIVQPSVPARDPPPVRISGGIGKGFPDTADFYPATSIRFGEAGVTAVMVCVDERGRLTADPKVAVSSGSARLDNGALALARAGSGHYRSASENGRAISACFQIGVRFALKD